jgi:hypothetical protein
LRFLVGRSKKVKPEKEIWNVEAMLHDVVWLSLSSELVPDLPIADPSFTPRHAMHDA